jgi:hypothetical protein
MPTKPVRVTGRGPIAKWGPNVYDGRFFNGAHIDVNANCQRDVTVNIQPTHLLELLAF